MALKEYYLNGLRYQFDENDVPNGAVPVDAPKRAAKRRTGAANKSRKNARNKAVE